MPQSFAPLLKASIAALTVPLLFWSTVPHTVPIGAWLGIVGLCVGAMAFSYQRAKEHLTDDARRATVGRHFTRHFSWTNDDVDEEGQAWLPAWWILLVITLAVWFIGNELLV